MKSVIDPVCGMSIDPQTAVARTTYENKEYLFCSTECKRQSDQNPKKYHEPRFTKSGPLAVPEFGAATSGGGEYEPLPDDSLGG